MEADFVPVSEIQQEPNLHATLFSPALDQAAQQACQQLWSNEDIPDELLFGIQLDEEDPKPTVVDYETISRRIHELPLVNSLSSSQVEQLVTTVHEAVGVDYKEFNRVINIIHWLQWQIDDGNTKVLLENLKADERQPGTKIVSISNKLKYSLLETFLQDIQKYKTQIGLLGMHIDWDDAPETLKDQFSVVAIETAEVSVDFTNPKGWSLCNQAEERLEAAVYDGGCLVMGNNEAVLKFNGKMCMLALENIKFANGVTLYSGVWYSVEHDDQQKLRNFYYQSQKSKISWDDLSPLDIHWTLMRGCRLINDSDEDKDDAEINKDTEQYLERIKTKVKSMAEDMTLESRKRHIYVQKNEEKFIKI